MKRIGFKALYLITALVVFAELGFAVYGSLFTEISELPKGTLSYTESSPSGEKKLNIYLVKNNLGVAIRGEIQVDDDRHNIFWQIGIDSVDASWSDDNFIVINDIPLNSNDTFGYDCRRGYSLFDEGSLEQNFMRSQDSNEKE